MKDLFLSHRINHTNVALRVMDTLVGCFPRSSSVTWQLKGKDRVWLPKCTVAFCEGGHQRQFGQSRTHGGWCFLATHVCICYPGRNFGLPLDKGTLCEWFCFPAFQRGLQHGNSLFVAGKMRVISNGRLPATSYSRENLLLPWLLQQSRVCFSVSCSKLKCSFYCIQHHYELCLFVRCILYTCV